MNPNCPGDKMKTFRRTTVGLVLSVMAAGLAMGSSASAQTVMRISISSPQNSHQGVAIDTFAKEVERLTNGRYVITTFYASSLGAVREAMESVILGKRELTWTSHGPVHNVVQRGRASCGDRERH